MLVSLSKHYCPTKFQYARRRLPASLLRILDVGCGNHSPTLTKTWFPRSHYTGADVQNYNTDKADLAAMDAFFPLGFDGSGYTELPDKSYDFIILNHVVEHILDPKPVLVTLCSKLKPGGFIWIAFPSLRSLSLPSADGTLQFCDDPTHVFVPDIREISNILLANGLSVIHAGRTRDALRTLIGLAILPWALLKKMTTGKLTVGLWSLAGFEDHVFGQRRLS
jgi:2-polyprenyl-3-methyl-5-hydroxy-6-metoxy-1,4-benzoquinol methylase